MKKSLTLPALTFSVFCFAVAATAQSAGQYVPCQEMPDIIQQYNADYRQLSRFYSPYNENSAGGRSASGSGPGDAPEKRERLDKLNHEYLVKLDKLNFSSLPQECKVDYILFKRDLNKRIMAAAREKAEYDKLVKWIPFADSIYATEKLRRRGQQLDAAGLSKSWDGFTGQLAALDDKVKTDSGFTADDVYASGELIGNLKKSLASTFVFYNEYDPLFTWWVPKAYKQLDEALDKYAAQFKAKSSRFRAADKSGIVGHPVGCDELVRMLKYEMVDYTPEELINIANKEFAWCDKEMLKASKEMGFGDKWKDALDKVKNSFVPAGKQPEMIVDLYNQSIDFLKKNDLITIPPVADETWGMTMMTPERQLENPFFLGGSDIIISYPTNTMNEDDRLMSMRGNNPHFSRATVHHELIAGHNLQFNSNARYRTYRNFGTGFWTEGWSLYWELLLWDLKFPRSPEDKIGMLFWHMHRCARIIFSLNYHMGKWTPQQCIDFLVDRVGHERANAAGEVRRSFEGRYDPLYQVAYLVGGREFYALKHELVDSGKMSYKQYHDAVMHLNAMPVEMVRAILTNQPLSKEYTTKWRFYDDLRISAND